MDAYMHKYDIREITRQTLVSQDGGIPHDLHSRLLTMENACTTSPFSLH